MEQALTTRLREELRRRVYPERKSIAELSKQIGISHQTFHRFLACKRISLESLDKIAKFLEVEP